jgi:hypothetical protein
MPELNENLVNQPGQSGTSGPVRNSLDERYKEFLNKQESWKQFNGGCPISSDMDQTLELLEKSVRPQKENIPGKVQAALKAYLQDGQNIRDVWMAKIAEGANYVGIVDGEFAFYRGNDRLETNNKPMEFSVMPGVMRFREAEKKQIHEQARSALLNMKNELKENNYQIDDIFT